MWGLGTPPWHSMAMLGHVSCRREASLVLRAALGIPLANSVNIIQDGRVQEAEPICSCLPTLAGAEESAEMLQHSPFVWSDLRYGRSFLIQCHLKARRTLSHSILDGMYRELFTSIHNHSARVPC